jgi:uncharacterized Zn finger protein
MKPMKSKGQQVTVDLSQAENIVCKSCGNYSFIQSFFLKRISALMSPTGQEAIVPVQVYSCGNCGEVYADGKDSES